MKLAQIFLLSLFISLPSWANWHSDTQNIMGTEIRVELWHKDETLAQKNIKLVMQEMHRIDELMSPYKEQAEIYQLNTSAAKSAQVISVELFDLINTALQVSQLTQGAFDISYASVGYLYNYREKLKPDEKAIQQKRQAIDYRLIVLDPSKSTVKFLHQDVKIDLGGIAKGYAVDRSIEILKGQGIKQAMVSAGGDSRILGDRRLADGESRPWMVGIKDPRVDDQQAVILPLSDTALSTSGDYERFYEKDGVRYHHIINPWTGDSARQVQGTSILGPDATTTDALSTAVFVLGVGKGLALINRLPGIEGLIIDAQHKLHYSDGLLARTE